MKSYSLKFTETDLQRINILCATDDRFRYKYDMFDTAVSWAHESAEGLVALAAPRSGVTHTCYIKDTVEKVKSLEEKWDCKAGSAVYTSVVSYLNHRLEQKDELIEKILAN